MANIITNSDVFEFIKVPDDVQTEHSTRITNLITREQENLEELLGRKVTSETFTDVLFSNNLNCRIYKDKLFLIGKYRDTYSITSITEIGDTLTASTDYNDGGDYYLDSYKGIIIRINNFWSLEQLAIKISGSLGLGGASPLENIKQALIEIVAAKSGLWKTNVETESGDITTITLNKISKDTKAIINRYILRDF